MKILKYPLHRNPNEFGVMKVELPVGARVVSAILQRETIVLYAQVSQTEVTNEVNVMIAGTGKDMEFETYRFVNTVPQGEFTWHIYIEQ